MASIAERFAEVDDRVKGVMAFEGLAVLSVLLAFGYGYVGFAVAMIGFVTAFVLSGIGYFYFLVLQ